jgi:hypothetical protein
LRSEKACTLESAVPDNVSWPPPVALNASSLADSENVPAGIRNAVLLRDKRCRWAGGCNQPASACEVHHTKHKKNGGPTSAADCVLLCTFHHEIAIHRWGWTLVLNPDGTTTAWNKDKTKVLHSHGPPAGPGNGPGRQANAA